MTEREPVFGPKSMNKALCGCGTIADLDTEVVRRKRTLGKYVECSRCRNIRIARERDELERHFSGIRVEDHEEFEVRPPFPVGLRYQLTKVR